MLIGVHFTKIACLLWEGQLMQVVIIVRCSAGPNRKRNNETLDLDDTEATNLLPATPLARRKRGRPAKVQQQQQHSVLEGSGQHDPLADEGASMLSQPEEHGQGGDAQAHQAWRKRQTACLQLLKQSHELYKSKRQSGLAKAQMEVLLMRYARLGSILLQACPALADTVTKSCF